VDQENSINIGVTASKLQFLFQPCDLFGSIVVGTVFKSPKVHYDEFQKLALNPRWG
jgi:hypothetical protein